MFPPNLPLLIHLRFPAFIRLLSSVHPLFASGPPFPLRGGHTFWWHAEESTHFPQTPCWLLLQTSPQSGTLLWVFRSCCLYLVLQNFPHKLFFCLDSFLNKEKFVRTKDFQQTSRGGCQRPFPAHLCEDGTPSRTCCMGEVWGWTGHGAHFPANSEPWLY